jgi:KipI family sensor histidine kinase inhibitor
MLAEMTGRVVEINRGRAHRSDVGEDDAERAIHSELRVAAGAIELECIRGVLGHGRILRQFICCQVVCACKEPPVPRGIGRTVYFGKMPMPTTDDAQFQPASDQSLLVYFGRKITLDAHQRVWKLLRLLESKPVAGVRNLHPAYCSLLVDFDARKLRHRELTEILRDYLERLETLPLPNSRELEIPTCYGGEFGPDLDEVAALHGMTPGEAVELHASVTYVVYFLGFVPGFAYLGELPDALATPRLASPRRTTPPGSVAIADHQTGVYPLATPGGWRLIGRTPLAIFRRDREHMSYLSIGDRVRFTPISAARFTALQNA